MISYYELLGMIKEGNIPKKIKVHLTPVSSRDYISEYDIDESFTYYRLENEKEENDDYRFCLADCFLESMMFDEKIEMLEEKKKIPRKINKSYKIRIFNSSKPHKIDYDMEQLIEMVQDIYSKQKEIIDFLNSKGE